MRAERTYIYKLKPYYWFIPPLNPQQKPLFWNKPITRAFKPSLYTPTRIPDHREVFQNFPQPRVVMMSLAKNGRRAQSIAAEHAREAVLMTFGNPNEINMTDSEGSTALLYTAANGHTLEVGNLLDNGASVDAADFQMRTPLSWAAAFGHIATSRLLLHHNADPNSQDIDGKTPLIHACINGHAELCAQLLDWNDTSPVLKDYNYSTPLLYAAAHGHDAIVEILLCHDQVKTDWALQGWKEETLKNVLRLEIPGEWDPDLDILWDANTGRMPQAHALLRGHTSTAALLSSYWDRLNLDARPVPPTATTKADEDDEAPRGRTRFHSVIGMSKSTEYSPERLAGKEENYWPWWWLETSLHVLKRKSL